MTKHVYTDGNDKIIAESAQEANAIWEERVGDTHDSENDPWRKVPDNGNIAIIFEDEIKPEYLPEGAKVQLCENSDIAMRVTATAEAWANSKISVDGFLCSTEY